MLNLSLRPGAPWIYVVGLFLFGRLRCTRAIRPRCSLRLHLRNLSLRAPQLTQKQAPLATVFQPAARPRPPRSFAAGRFFMPVVPDGEAATPDGSGRLREVVAVVDLMNAASIRLPSVEDLLVLF